MFNGNFPLKKSREREHQTQTGFSIKELVEENHYIRNKR